MKQNVPIYVRFNNSPNGTFTLPTIGFKVKSIHIKSVAYITTTAPAAGTSVYVMLLSDLTRWQPMALVYQDSTYPANQFCDVSFKFEHAEKVAGQYTLSMKSPNGGDGVATGADDYVMMLLEFNDENEQEY